MSETQAPPDPNLMAAVQTCNEIMQQGIIVRAALIVAQRKLADARIEIDVLKAAAREPDAARAVKAVLNDMHRANGTAPHETA